MAKKKKTVRKTVNKIKKSAPKKKAKKKTSYENVAESSVFVPLTERYVKSLLGGQPVAYTPDELLTKFSQYVKEVDTNPLHELKVFANGYSVKVPKMRAMSISGFCVFASIHRDTFHAYSRDSRYSDIVNFMKDVMFAQKFEGAAADLLNASIISRDLGLVDKTSLVDNNGDAVTGFNYVVPQQPIKNQDNE